MSMQNLCDLKFKNNTKKTYYFYINYMYYLVAMSWYETCHNPSFELATKAKAYKGGTKREARELHFMFSRM